MKYLIFVVLITSANQTKKNSNLCISVLVKHKTRTVFSIQDRVIFEIERVNFIFFRYFDSTVYNKHLLLFLRHNNKRNKQDYYGGNI